MKREQNAQQKFNVAFCFYFCNYDETKTLYRYNRSRGNVIDVYGGRTDGRYGAGVFVFDGNIVGVV